MSRDLSLLTKREKQAKWLSVTDWQILNLDDMPTKNNVRTGLPIKGWIRELDKLDSIKDVVNLRRTKIEMSYIDAELMAIVEKLKPMTVRQAFYQAVVNYLVIKSDTGYNFIQKQLLKLRQDGVMPYGWITDSSRNVKGYAQYEDKEHFYQRAPYLFNLDVWQYQNNNVEIWIEKEALASTIAPIVIQEWCLDLHVSKGFSSESYLYEAGQSIQRKNKPTHVYVLSDFDPSGVSLAEDIKNKLSKFSGDVPTYVNRLALDISQIESWDLPTHDLKNNRAKPAFVKKYGVDYACELDAIPPDMLRQLVNDAIQKHVDIDDFNYALNHEQEERQEIETFLEEAA